MSSSICGALSWLHMPSEVRLRRIAERLRLELASLLERELSDPRLRMLSVTEVTVDRELSTANVWVSAILDEAGQKAALQALRGASGFLRRELTRRVELRTMPQLKFHWDASPERGERLSRLLDSLKEEGPSTQPRPTDPESHVA